MTDTPAIEIVNLGKRFGGAMAVENLSLSIDQGQFVSLLGPSGCGKSTILRSIAGFIRPDSGTIHVAGRNITHDPAHVRSVKMVFQDYALFPHMTVFGNIGFGCEMQGMSRGQVARRVQELLDLIQLPGAGERYPDELSGGQRQRVALARALAPDPDALLLDEPLAALDLNLRRQMQQELKTIQRSTGKTFVFVTHDQEEAMSMSDRIAVMNAGGIEQLGTPEEIYLRPASLFVARFVGSANLLPARVIDTETNTLVLDTLGQRWRLPRSRVTSRTEPGPGDTATIVVRPDAIAAGPGREGTDLRIDGSLEGRMFFGSRIRLSLRLANGLAFQVEIPATDEPSPGRGAGERDFSGHCRPERVILVAEDTGILTEGNKTWK